MFERADLAIALMDLHGRLIEANAAFQKMFCSTAPELHALSLVELTHRDDKATELACFAMMIEGASDSYQLEKRYHCKDGKVMWGHQTVSLVRNADGTPRFAIGTITDITRRKQTEEEFLRLSTAIEQSAEMVVITDADGTIRYVNPAFERVTGYTRKEVIGRTPRILKSGKHEEAFYRELWRTIASGRTWQGHIVNNKKDGTSYEEDATILPVRNVSGRIVNYVKVGRDVTRQMILEEQLRQSQKMETIGSLTGGIAHDFNNFLTVIIGYTELLQRSLNSEGPLLRLVGEILKAATQASELTNRLLTFSRKATVAPRVMNLNTIVNDVEHMLRGIIGEDVTLKITLEPELWNVRVGSGQIEQIIFNLATNARDAMPDGGLLTIGTKNVAFNQASAQQHGDVRPGNYVMVSVSDTGIGMDEQTKARIFEPFFSTKGEEGTGLGLATVYGIVQQHGGTIQCSSELRKGTTFRIYLPAVDAPVEAGSVHQSRETSKGKETILVVEDSPGILTMVTQVLEQQGYTVLQAATGKKAIELVGQHSGPIHLLLTDLVLPDMDGREVADRLAQTIPETRVLFTSGHANDVIARHSLSCPSVGFIKKPYRMGDLLPAIRECLDRTRG